jgi:hypothetical protein
MFKKIKENRRYKALFELSLFLIFFAIMFLIITFTGKSSSTYEEPFTYKDYTSYNFEVIIEENEQVFTYMGKRNNNEYQINDLPLNINETDDPILLNNIIYTPQYINNLLNIYALNKESIYATTKEEVKEYIKDNDIIEITSLNSNVLKVELIFPQKKITIKYTEVGGL